jgi:hypothetical protein
MLAGIAPDQGTAVLARDAAWRVVGAAEVRPAGA